MGLLGLYWILNNNQWTRVYLWIMFMVMLGWPCMILADIETRLTEIEEIVENPVYAIRMVQLIAEINKQEIS